MITFQDLLKHCDEVLTSNGHPVEDYSATVGSSYFCDGKLIATTTTTMSPPPAVPMPTGNYYWVLWLFLAFMVFVGVLLCFKWVCNCVRKKSIWSRKKSDDVIRYNRANGPRGSSFCCKV